jgi:hypothetical protein
MFSLEFSNLIKGRWWCGEGKSVATQKLTVQKSGDKYRQMNVILLVKKASISSGSHSSQPTLNYRNNELFAKVILL